MHWQKFSSFKAGKRLLWSLACSTNFSFLPKAVAQRKKPKPSHVQIGPITGRRLSGICLGNISLTVSLSVLNNKQSFSSSPFMPWPLKIIMGYFPPMNFISQVILFNIIFYMLKDWWLSSFFFSYRHGKVGIGVTSTSPYQFCPNADFRRNFVWSNQFK